MKFFITTCCFALLISTIEMGCSNHADEQPQNTSNTTINQPAADTTAIVKPVLDLDINAFVHRADSLLSSIQGNQVQLAFQLDSITQENISQVLYLKSLNPAQDVLIKRYTFDAGNGNGLLRFWLVEANYPDSASAGKAFRQLHNLAIPSEGLSNSVVGLTYANDYVIRTDHAIYWLNTGCAYAFYNHQKMAQLLVQSISTKRINHAIWCQCGHTGYSEPS